jgi:hypothetical protein
MEDESRRGRVGERESLSERTRNNINSKELKDATKLCVKWTLPSEKLLLIKLTCVILLEGRVDSFPSMHSSM